VAADAEQLVRPQADVDVQVAGRPAAQPRAAFARHAQALPVGGALGDAHLGGPGHPLGPALRADLGEGQRDLDLGAAQQVVDARVQGDLHILPRHLQVLTAGAPAETTAARTQARQQVEQVHVAQIFKAAEAAARVTAETLAPIRRRTEILARLVRADLVVGGPLLGVLQDLVGLAHLLEALLGVLLLGHVRVVLARELAVRLLDVPLGGAALDAQDLVVVLVLHSPSFTASRKAA
jgi:hypothetical protein